MPWMRSSLEWFKERTVSFLWENTYNIYFALPPDILNKYTIANE
jgi:hypothetical protein